MVEIVGYARKDRHRLIIEKLPSGGYRTNNTGSFGYTYRVLGDLVGFLVYQGYSVDLWED